MLPITGQQITGRPPATATRMDPSAFKTNMRPALGAGEHIIRSKAAVDDYENRKDFEFELSFLCPDDAKLADILTHVEDALIEHDFTIYEDSPTMKQVIGGSYVRGDVITWRADGRVFVSISRSSNKMVNNKLASIAIKTFKGKWTADNGRNPALYLKATDFQRGKQLKPCEQQYISQRQKTLQTYTNTVPQNGVVADIDSISGKMMQHRKSCVLKRKRLDDLIEEQNKLQKELDDEEESLVEMQRKHMDVLRVHIEAKKQQKHEYEMKLSRKMHTIERMQEEYQQLEDELQPFIKNVQSQIEKLEKISTCTERVHAATSPSIVDAIAAANLPTMSSDGSDN